MNAILLTGYGDFEKLEYTADAITPKPKGRY
jgi:hypothetical protein